MVRLSEIIKESLEKSGVAAEKKSVQNANDTKGETIDQEAFEKVKIGEEDEQKALDNLDKGIWFKDIIAEKKEALKMHQKEDKEKIKQYEQIYDKIDEFLKAFILSAKASKKTDLSEGFKLIKLIVDNPKAVDVLYKRAIYSKEMDMLVSHLVNVMIYSLKVGAGLGFNKEQLIELALASLFHDIGIIHIPEDIINKTDKLTDDEFNLIKKHPYFGNEILSKLYPEYPWIAEVSLQEHEREGGQGYPKGLKGNEINVYAKIIGIVDIFEALTHPRPHRKRFLPNEAVKMIVQKEKDSFPSVIIKAILIKLSAFPLYSYVRLNSKAIGIVIEVDESSPLRPSIQILFDNRGAKIIGEKILKLKDTPLLYITDSIDEDDLPK